MAEDGVNRNIRLLAVGGSAGSLDVLMQLLPTLSRAMPFAIVVVVHRRSVSDSGLSDLFAARTSIPVKEAEEKESIRPGCLYVAPADYHLLIEKDKTFSLDYSEKINYSRPAIDITFETAAEAYGPSLACLLLSGANADGAQGLTEVRAAGGLVLVQDPATAEVGYMPQQAIDAVAPDFIIPTDQIPHFIRQLAGL